MICGRLSMTESELTLAETKVSDLSRQLVLTKEERGHADKLHETELQHERQVGNTINSSQKTTRPSSEHD